jgi:hypothetical protein
MGMQESMETPPRPKAVGPQPELTVPPPPLPTQQTQVVVKDKPWKLWERRLQYMLPIVHYIDRILVCSE